MVSEGTLEELTSIENQHELVIENADEGLLESINELIKKHANHGGNETKLVSSGRPRSSLEKLFIDTANSRVKKRKETN